jgi:7-cyano-7-deazaguanine synthase
MTRAVIVCSGGLDSTTLAYHLRERDVELVPVFFDYGQHCVEQEWRTLQEVLPKAGAYAPERVSIADVFRHSRSRLIVESNPWNDRIADSELYVPYRTLLFFSVAAAYAQSADLTDVYSGFINSNHAKELDCSAAFLNQLDGLAENVGPVRFHMPFRNW